MRSDIADSVDLFDKLVPVRAAVDAVAGVNPFATQLSPTEVVIEGRRTMMFGSNNYLGLAFDAGAIEAGVAALRTWGTGTTGTRVANGTLAIHRDLERALAAAFDKRHARIFTTGHQANLSVIAGLCAAGDTVLIDAESHASIFDAARLSGATIIAFRHNDVHDLRRKLGRLPHGATNRLVVVEGLYSTSGDIAPLSDIVATSKDSGAYVLVDEAHSFGVFGARGLGCVESEEVLDAVDFIVGTFSKSLGGVGGFCVSNHRALELLHFTARAYLFTASSSAATVSAARAALDRLVAGHELRTRLWRNVRYFRDGLRQLGFTIGKHESPVVAIHVGDSELAMALWSALLNEGVYVNLVLPPACPHGKARLRASCTAAHSIAKIDEALERLARAAKIASRDCRIENLATVADC